MHHEVVDLDKLVSEVSRRLYDVDPDSWWAGVIYDAGDAGSALRQIVDRYDGAPDGVMPPGDLVSLACWAVSGIPPVDYPWFLKAFPWISGLR